MTPETQRQSQFRLDYLELSRSSLSTGEMIMLNGGEDPKKVEKYSKAIANIIGPDMVRFFDMKKRTIIDSGNRNGTPVIDHIHAHVTRVEGVVDVASVTFRMYDWAVNISNILLSNPFMQGEITIADWNTYEENRTSGLANRIDPASVIVHSKYEDEFKRDFQSMMADCLPIVGLYNVRPYDPVRERFFRPYITQINQFRAEKAYHLGISDEDYVDIVVDKPIVKSTGALRNLRTS